MIIYRCERCGRWSHAATMPKHHRRFVTDEPSESEIVLGVVTGERDVYTGEGWEGGWFIACGPFAAWTAERL